MSKEEALRDPRNNKSLLAEYNSLTKKVQADEDGNLMVNLSESELSQAEGGQKELRVSDDNAQELLNEVLKQLKIMNMHLALMTDTHIRKQEV